MYEPEISTSRRTTVIGANWAGWVVSPTNITRPPDLTMATACSGTGETPAVSKTTSGPSPPVICFTTFTGSDSRPLTISSAPSLRANSNLSGTTSTATTRHPAALAHSRASRPIEPQPMMATVSPTWARDLRTQCSDTVSGSTRAPCLYDTLSGKGQMYWAGTWTYSACAPSMSTPSGTRL